MAQCEKALAVPSWVPLVPRSHRKVCGKSLLTVPWASHAHTNMHTSHTSHTHKKDLFYFVCICVWVCPCECGWPHRPEVSETPGTGVISTCKPAGVGAGNWTLELFSGRAVHALHFRAISSAHKVTFLKRGKESQSGRKPRHSRKDKIQTNCQYIDAYSVIKAEELTC